MEKYSKMRLLPKLSRILCRRPNAFAAIAGSKAYPDISGCVRFFQTACGVLVAAEVSGLPQDSRGYNDSVFAFHIHEGENCNQNGNEPFSAVGSHYDKNVHTHPFHSGDMPPLFGNGGYALTVFLTDRFCIDDIIGRTVIIHSGLDDFSTQPSGNAGQKIACGEIKKV